MRRADATPYTINPSQAFTQATPLELAAQLAGTVSGQTESLGSLADTANPLVGDLAAWLAGYNPDEHHEIPRTLGSLGGLLKGNLSALQAVERINSAEPHSRTKLKPRTKAEAAEALVGSGLAPAPYNVKVGQRLAAGKPRAKTAQQKANEWIVHAEHVTGAPIDQAIRAAEQTKVAYAEQTHELKKRLGVKKLTGEQRTAVKLDALAGMGTVGGEDLAVLSDTLKAATTPEAFVTSDGSPLTRFRRAIQHGSAMNAEAGARELGRLDLGDALALVELYSARRDRRFEAAAKRWSVRLIQEVPNLTLEESALALNALLLLDRLPKYGSAQEALAALCRRHAIIPPRAVNA